MCDYSLHNVKSRPAAVREGLLLRYKFPHDDIKVCEVSEEIRQGTVFH
jgi:hypothetical protein